MRKVNFFNIEISEIMSNCVCPAPTELTTIPDFNCEVHLRQIQKYAFQRKGFKFETGTLITDLASWTPLLTANDATKVVISPFIGGNPTIEAGESLTEGGNDNSTLNGIEKAVGEGPATVSADFRGLPSEVVRAMKELECFTDLTVYFFLEGGRIAALNLEAVANEYTGFDVLTYFFGSRQNNGFATDDINNMTFQMPADWALYMEIIQPNFNPLTDL